MPKRTNVFQEIVTIIHEHMAGDAHVERSGYLRHRVTGRNREVDAVIRSKVAGHEVIVSVEAKGVEKPATARPVDVGWVEEYIEKHRNLPTTKLVLVSESGFTDAARKQAEHENAVVLAPEDLVADDPAYAVMTALPSLWPKEVTLEPEMATVLLRRPDEARPLVTDSGATLAVYLEDGRTAGSLRDLLKFLQGEHAAVFAETMQLDSITEDTTRGFTFTMRGPLSLDSGENLYLYLRSTSSDADELHEIQEIEFRGQAIINVCEIPLQYKRLGEITVAYGEGNRRPTCVMVVSYDEAGGKATIRDRPGSTRGG